MSSEDSQPNSRTWRHMAIQFLLGAALASLFILIPLSYVQYFTPDAVRLVHWVGSAVAILACGTLAAFRGGKFVQFLTHLLESMPSV